MKKSYGFTLIEILVVISVMGILGVIFTDILSQALRGQSKVKVISEVKQNGQMVLNKLTQEIRQAEEIICPEAEGNTIVIFKEGLYSRFRLHDPVLNGNKANGKITRYDFTADEIPNTAYSELCTTWNPLTQPQALTNTNLIDGVSVEREGNEPVFKLQKKPGFADTVVIKFKATAGLSAGSAYETSVKEGGVLFTTTAQVRGLKQ